MPRKITKPSYLLHRASGQARVRINGKDHYLGPYGSKESKEVYADLIEDWLLRNETAQYALTIDALALRYLSHAETYYVKNGQPTSELSTLRIAERVNDFETPTVGI
jgi:hypothetical protein